MTAHPTPVTTMNRKTAVISSTAVDLPDHRQKVKQACLEAHVYPEMMESLGARDEDAISSSMKLVDGADVYIGIFAYRYGHVPNGHAISITEMEFDRAVQRSITILPFEIDPKHPILREMVEADEHAQRKLEELKCRAREGRGRKLFASADELYGQVLGALKDFCLQADQARLRHLEAAMKEAYAAHRQELSRLRKENRLLKAALAKLREVDA